MVGAFQAPAGVVKSCSIDELFTEITAD